MLEAKRILRSNVGKAHVVLNRLSAKTQTWRMLLGRAQKEITNMSLETEEKVFLLGGYRKCSKIVSYNDGKSRIGM